MDSFDHFPHDSTMERAALIADVCAQVCGLITAPIPGGSPARDPLVVTPTPPPVAPALPPPTRYRLRFGVMECTICGYAQAFCGCAKRSAPSPPSGDARVESSLVTRIRECQGGR